MQCTLCKFTDYIKQVCDLAVDVLEGSDTIQSALNSLEKFADGNPCEIQQRQIKSPHLEWNNPMHQ